MSDKETAPWTLEAARKINRTLFPGQWPESVVQKIAEIISGSFAEECTAQAPQTDAETAPWAQKVAAEMGWEDSNVSAKETAPKPCDSFRDWLIHGGGGHEDGECGIRACTLSLSGAIEMVDQYLEYRAECTAQAPTQRWISVKDELPRPQQFVIAYYGEDDMEITWHTGEIWSPSEPDNPTHWQPLPLGPDGATPQGTPDTQWIKPKFPATTPEEWREFGKTLATPQGTPTETTGLFPPNSSKNWQKESK